MALRIALDFTPKKVMYREVDFYIFFFFPFFTRPLYTSKEMKIYNEEYIRRMREVQVYIQILYMKFSRELLREKSDATIPYYTILFK